MTFARFTIGRRTRGFGAAVVLFVVATVLAGCGVPQRSFVVNSTVDAPDAAPGDNQCQTAVAGQCTLRAAIQEANATPQLDQITLAPVTLYQLTIAGADEDAAATGDLDVTHPLILHA